MQHNGKLGVRAGEKKDRRTYTRARARNKKQQEEQQEKSKKTNKKKKQDERE